MTAFQEGGPNEPFFTSVYVDDSIMASVQVDSFDQTALVASASLDSDNMVLVGSGEKENKPILAPKESTDRNSIVDALITKERVRCHSRHIRAGLAKRKSVYASARCVEYGVKNCEN